MAGPAAAGPNAAPADAGVGADGGGGDCRGGGVGPARDVVGGVAGALAGRGHVGGAPTGTPLRWSHPPRVPASPRFGSGAQSRPASTAAALRAGDGSAAAGNPRGGKIGDAAAAAGARERPGAGGPGAGNTGGGTDGGAAGAGSRRGGVGDTAGVGSRRGGVSGASPPPRRGYPRPSRGDAGGGAQSRSPPPLPRPYP